MSASTAEYSPPLGCFLPVLILAAYAAVHLYPIELRLDKIFLAAYAAVHCTDVLVTF